MPDTEALRRIGIDPEEGMAYCADDPEFYEEMLREYLAESEIKAAELREFYEERSWQRYGICAHSVKSTSRMIGAKALSERAHELELAGREENEGAILAGHERFLKAYTALTDELRTVLEL